MFRLNKKYYDDLVVAASYANRTELFKGEEVILSRLQEEFKDASVLDIGVGPGRTTPYLRALSRHYVGIDYSEVMLTPCRAKHPDVGLVLGDARALCFPRGSFDLVHFGWNTIDDSDHEDRLRMLSEVHRVLRTGGVFFFSSHNREATVISAYHFRGFAFSANPLELMKENLARIARYGCGIYNHLRFKRYEVHEKRYAIVNDPPYSYRTLNYAITKEDQITQLEELGFGDVQVVGLDGSLIESGQRCDDAWLYYVARKDSTKVAQSV
jgi:SAM-dependent methyltransferase